MTPAELFQYYQSLGFKLLYWERKGPSSEWKGPRDKGWNDPERVYDLAGYNPETMNLGVFTGIEIAPGKFLHDYDFDWAPGLPFARKIIPPTKFGFGRVGKKVSHAFITLPEQLGIIKYCDIAETGEGDGATFIELRGGNYSHMTMVAPSLHSEGVVIELVMKEEILHTDVQRSQDGALDYSVCSIIYNHLRGGLHHDARLAMAGFLLRKGLSPERVLLIGEEIVRQQIVDGVADMSIKDIADMTLVVSTTLERLKTKDKRVAGGPKLAELMGERGKAVIARMRYWFDGVKTDALILNSEAPMDNAEVFVEAHYTLEEKILIHNQNGVFYRYAPPAYTEHDEAAMRAEVWKFLDTALAWSGGKEPTLGPFNPNTNKVSNTVDALKGVTNLPMTMAPPVWINNNPGLNALDILPCVNGLLHIPDRRLLPNSPDFFTLNGLNFPYDPQAPEPETWQKFLLDLWEDDPECIATLQEIFGYLLTPDTRFQKILMLIGPKRSGKSLIGRIIAKLIGEQNTVSPTLSSFGGPFGKESLVGKNLAIIADARISGRSDTAAIAETLLSISGEDPQTVDRKYKAAWSGKLPTRFLIITNEMPKIGDMSGALTSRFISLMLTKSFFGKEDLGLFDKIEPELPGILNWALEGRDRLYARKYFVQPQSSEEMMQEFADLSSPSNAFFREAVIGPSKGEHVTTEDLFKLWKIWCESNGQDYPGTAQNFGKSVRASIPYVLMKQIGPRGNVKKCWVNIRLSAEWAEKLVGEGPKDGNQPPFPTDSDM